MENEVATNNLESVRKTVGKKKISTCSDEKPAPKKGSKKGAKTLKVKLSKRFSKK